MNEIVFVVTNENDLIISLSMGKKEGVHFTSIHPLQPLTIAQWRSLCTTPSDREVFESLIQEEMTYQKQKTGKTLDLESFLCQNIHVSPKKSFSIFQLLAAAKHVYYGGKTLVIDLYSKVEFFYEGRLKRDLLEITGHFRWQGSECALGDCLTVGRGHPHHWFIKGVSLKFIQTEVAWSRLDELKKGPLILERGLKQEFLSSLQDEDSPQLVMKEGSLEALAYHTQPLPILQLKDRMGASADLLFDYGLEEYVSYHDPLDSFKGIKRQKTVEKEFEKDLLETSYGRKTALNSHYFCPLDKIGKSLCFLLEIGWKVRDVLNKEVVKQSAWQTEMEEKGDILALKGEMSFESFKADATQVALAFNRREKFISLSPDKVGLLNEDFLSSSWQDIFSESEIIGEEIVLKRNRIGLLSALKEVVKVSPTCDQVKQGWENFQKRSSDFSCEHFLGTLRPYQKQGVDWLFFLYDSGFHGILADEMGLGKTVQVLAFLSCFERKPHLIIVPTSLVFNWRHEIEKFLPHVHCLVHEGSRRSKSRETLEKADIIVTSYALLRQDLPLFQSVSYECLILDEAQMIKNAHTQTAEAVCALDAKFRLCMTGTPVENHLDELWSHFHFLMPDLLGSENEFQMTVQSASSDIRHLHKIKKKIAPFILRRKKIEVAQDLPELVEQTIFVEMGEAQRQCYDDLLTQFKGGLMKKVALDGVKAHRMEVLEAILRLRQVCCHPLLVSSLMASECESAKCDALFNDLETLVEEGHKALVYSQFTSMLHIMTRKAQEKGWKFCVLEGATKNREEVVRQFQEDKETNLFFMSLKAGGVGLNLTEADYVYLFDPWWNNAVEEQAIGRAHRIGRKKTIFAKRLIMCESIEEKMVKLKASKNALIQTLFDEESSFTSWSLEDLLGLIY